MKAKSQELLSANDALVTRPQLGAWSWEEGVEAPERLN